MKAAKRIFLALCLALGTHAASADANSVANNRVVAVVNNSVILQSELDAQTDKFLKRVQKEVSSEQMPPIEFIKRQALEQLINEELTLQLAKRNGLTVTDMQLDEYLEAGAKMEGKKVRDIYDEYFQKYGMTPAETREELKRESLISQVQHMSVRQRVHISNHEIERIVKNMEDQGGTTAEYAISSMFIKVPENATTEQETQTEELAQKVYQLLIGGADFSKIAKEYADNATISETHGKKEIEYKPLSSIPSFIALRLPSTKKGDILSPVRHGSGFIIVRVDGVKGFDAGPDIEVKSRHILIKPTQIFSEKKVVDKLNLLRKDILDGKISFEDAAKQYSEDPASSVDGGELNWANPDTYDPIFKAELLTLSKMEISKPFKSSFGWHIVQLEDRRQLEGISSALKDKAAQMLYQKRYNEELMLWLNDLRNSSFVQITDPTLSDESLMKLK